MIYRLLVFIILFASCSGEGNKKKAGETSSSTADLSPESIPVTRETVNKTPVATYSEKIENPLNDWKFKVELFETPQTFKYLMTLEYEEMNEKDTLRIPNLGFAPKPEIRKGDEKNSCIIGFIDNENQFREFKKVSGKDNNLKVKTLKHYGLYQKPADK